MEKEYGVKDSFFASALTILFVASKLTGKIDWSWWWVLSPIWITAVIAILVVAITIIVGKK